MKIYLDTIGCRLNQSEIETYARQFRSAGHMLVSNPAEADMAVINTCTVTSAAAADSRKKIRGMERAGVPEVVVTGCWSTLEPEAAIDLEGVTRNIPNQEKNSLVPMVLDLPLENLEVEPLVRVPIPGSRSRTRAFIKVQDGCDNRCAFCITTIARGKGRSRSIEAVVNDINFSLNGGVKEVVLTGVHMGSWGRDFNDRVKFETLVESVLKMTDIPRIRLSSLEPWDIKPEFFRLWENPRLARHLHLPLQSGCRMTLKRMARNITPSAYEKLLENAREAVPGIAITTDIIVGFPGESETEFAESLDFVAKMDFAHGHVFTYSERPGTPASLMSGSVPYPTRKIRNAKMQRVIMRSRKGFQNRFIGHHHQVLWESAEVNGFGGWKLNGLTDNYLRVSAVSTENLWNQLSSIKLSDINESGMVGLLEEENSNYK